MGVDNAEIAQAIARFIAAGKLNSYDLFIVERECRKQRGFIGPYSIGDPGKMPSPYKRVAGAPQITAADINVILNPPRTNSIDPWSVCTPDPDDNLQINPLPQKTRDELLADLMPEANKPLRETFIFYDGMYFRRTQLARVMVGLVCEISAVPNGPVVVRRVNRVSVAVSSIKTKLEYRVPVHMLIRLYLQGELQ